MKKPKRATELTDEELVNRSARTLLYAIGLFLGSFFFVMGWFAHNAWNLPVTYLFAVVALGLYALYLRRVHTMRLEKFIREHKAALDEYEEHPDGW